MGSTRSRRRFGASSARGQNGRGLARVDHPSSFHRIYMGFADFALVVDMLSICFVLFDDILPDVTIHSLGGLDTMGNTLTRIPIAFCFGPDRFTLEAITSDASFADIHSRIDELHVPGVVQYPNKCALVIGVQVMKVYAIGL